MSTGQAEAANSIEDLASFLGGEPEEAHEVEEQADSQLEESQGDQEEASDEPSDEAEAEDAEDDDGERPEDQTSRLIKITEKGEDGVEVVREVTEDELKTGYMKGADYTRKTMELADRERQAAEIVQQRVIQANELAAQQTQMAMRAVWEVAGVKSDEELEILAVEDPTRWVQESQKKTRVLAKLQQMDSNAKAHLAQAEQARLASEQQEAAEAWKVLSQKGMTHDKLADLYGKVSKSFGVTPKQLGKILEPGVVEAFKDAIAYRELKAKKPQITQKVKEAERLPTQKKALPQNERNTRALNERFSKGRAKTNDLAAFLAANKL